MPARTELEEGECGACHIFIGGKEEHHIEEYREHNICSWCQTQWRVREKLAGREITWDKLRKGEVK